MSKLAFFPTPYPDEDFRSIVYRYHVHIGQKNFNLTNRELFDVKTDRNPHVPRNLVFSLEKLPFGQTFSVPQILQQYTLTPLVKPFLTTDQVKASLLEVEHGVDGGNKNFAVRHLSVRRNRVLSEEIRYCPKCLYDDYDLYGECYLHRSHQFHSIDICVHHKVKLITRCPRCSQLLASKMGNKLLSLPRCSCDHSLLDSIKYTNVDETKIKTEHFVDCNEIMDASDSITRADILRRFNTLLLSKGYVFSTGKGTIAKKKFFDDFKTFLKDLHLPSDILPKLSRSSWAISTVSRNDWPLQSIPVYTYMMKFLTGSVTEFLWGKSIVLSPSLSTWNLENSSISQAATWKVIASGFSEVAASHTSEDCQQVEHREQILSVITEHGVLTRQQMKKLVPKAYNWLFTNDRQWIEKNLPRLPSGPMPPDWESIDQELVTKVQIASQDIYNMNPPKRIVRNMILGNLCPTDRDRLNYVRGKLPHSRAMLLACEESVEHYQIRHVPALVKQLLQSGYTNVTLNSILAFRRSYRGCSNHVRLEIVSILENMGFHDTEHGMDRYRSKYVAPS